MYRNHRREFLADVGRGMLLASVGQVVAQDLGLASGVMADDSASRLTFGAIEPLVALMQDTPIERLIPTVVGKIKSGEDFGRLVTAAALANARTFGGNDYEGYHTLMALVPAYQMSRELSDSHKALPILKVFYRNTNHIQQLGGHSHEALHPIDPVQLSPGQCAGEALRDAVRRRDVPGAERMFAALTEKSVPMTRTTTCNTWCKTISMCTALSWPGGRGACSTLPVRKTPTRCCANRSVSAAMKSSTSRRASCENCCRNCSRPRACSVIRPRLREATDQWIESLSHTIYAADRKKAAEAVAQALAEGFSPEAVGEAISLAANQLVLHDPGRKKEEPGKAVGSVHGASVGVHASDAANAWRNIARVSNRRNTVASMIVGAYHTAGQAGGLNPKPYPFAEHREKVRSVAPDQLLAEAETAIKAKDQVRACALIHRYGELGRPERPVFDMLLRYAISEDGALHAEKYYRTVTEEFAVARPAFRWNHLAGLARVTASEFGYPAPGVAEARKLLGV